MKYNKLFPIPVAFEKLNRDLTNEELEVILNQEKKKNFGNLVSCNSYVLELKELKNLKEFIQSCIDAYLKDIYAPDYDVKIRITQSWVNYTSKDEHHHRHTHPNSLISGVFYPQVNKDSDKIYFFKDGHRPLSIETSKWNEFNSLSWWFPLSTNDVILFPSELTHSVDKVTGNDTRVSIAFNTFPVGVIGNKNDLTELLL